MRVLWQRRWERRLAVRPSHLPYGYTRWVGWRLTWEWEPRDFWVGIYWHRQKQQLDVWWCLIPMLPLHLHYER